MITNFKLAATFNPTFPLSLIADGQVAPSLSLLPAVSLTPQAAPRPAVRLDRVAALRLQIAAGTYRVSAMQLADCMIGAIFAA